MAVYTQVSEDDIRAFLKKGDLGDYVSHEGITKGVENTNYRLTTTSGPFILTLVEKRTAPEDLPFIFSYMRHLKASGIRVPEILAEGIMAGKPAAILEFLPGRDPAVSALTPDHCAQAGTTLARMHKAAENFKGTRANPVGPAQWQKLFDAVKDRLDTNTAAIATRTLDECTCAEWKKLPNGAIHADFFCDNVFFDEAGRLSGVIDFYFACVSAFAYDLAIAVNAWCFDKKGQIVTDNLNAFLNAYESIRPLSADERAAFPGLRRAGALRILMTRFYDFYFTPKDATVVKHDPAEYLAKLKSDFKWP